MPQGNRQHARRYSMSRRIEPGQAAQVTKQARARFLAVQQQGGLLAASTGVGGQQGLDFQALFASTRIDIAKSATRANRAAGTAADAQIGVDHNLLATTLAADG